MKGNVSKSITSNNGHKHNTEENWGQEVNFIPEQGEVIIYDIDGTYDYERFKIGDGKTVVGQLPFFEPSGDGKINPDDIDGVIPAEKGGTGVSKLTSGCYLVGNGTEDVVLKTPAEVLADIGAGNMSALAGSYTVMSSGLAAAEFSIDMPETAKPTLMIVSSNETSEFGIIHFPPSFTTDTSGMLASQLTLYGSTTGARVTTDVKAAWLAEFSRIWYAGLDGGVLGQYGKTYQYVIYYN